jgi:hypothetical protein
MLLTYWTSLNRNMRDATKEGRAAVDRGGLMQSAVRTELLVTSREYHNNWSVYGCRQFCDGCTHPSIAVSCCFYLINATEGRPSWKGNIRSTGRQFRRCSYGTGRFINVLTGVRVLGQINNVHSLICHFIKYHVTTVAYLLKGRTVESGKQPFLGNRFVITQQHRSYR